MFTSDSDANDSQYLNPEYDALIEHALTAEDPLPDYQSAEAMLARDIPLIPIYFYSSNFLLDDTLKGWPYENAQEYWYAKDFYQVAEQ